MNQCSAVLAKAIRWFLVRPVVFVATTVPWGLLFDWFMLLLGPALILLATSIVGWCQPPTTHACSRCAVMTDALPTG